MKELFLIAVGAALVNNVVLSQFLGLCPFLGVSKKVKTAASHMVHIPTLIKLWKWPKNMNITYMIIMEI